MCPGHCGYSCFFHSTFSACGLLPRDPRTTSPSTFSPIPAPLLQLPLPLLHRPANTSLHTICLAQGAEKCRLLPPPLREETPPPLGGALHIQNPAFKYIRPKDLPLSLILASPCQQALLYPGSGAQWVNRSLGCIMLVKHLGHLKRVRGLPGSTKSGLQKELPLLQMKKGEVGTM